jgi:hypothetical protein
MMASELVYLRDLDGSGSMHVCAATDAGAVPYVPETTLTARVAEQDAEIARLSWDRGQMWETLTYVRYASDCEVTRNAAAETLDEISALEPKP